MAQYIALSGKNGQGKYAIVDDDWYEELSKYKWYLNHKGYAFRHGPVKNKKQPHYIMHREILGLTAGDKREVDHINGSKLDNTLNNLRECSRKENSRNRKKFKLDSSSIYKGVYFSKNRWAASIQVDEKQIYIGMYATETEAALAYDEAARIYHGNFAALNFPHIYVYDLTKISHNKYTKHKYIYFHKVTNKWCAYYKEGGIRKYIGSYDSENEAYCAQTSFLSKK